MSLPEQPCELSDLNADDAGVAGRTAQRDHLPANASFEETYPKHEFSELVRLALVLASCLVRGRRLLVVKPDAPPVPPPGAIAAAD